jgi:hypothetical protein
MSEKKTEADETTEASTPAKPKGLRGREFLAAVAADLSAEQIDFTIAGIPCFVQFRGASYSDLTRYATTLQCLGARGDSLTEQEATEAILTAHVTLAARSIADCSLARKIGGEWHPSPPPEVESQRQAWLKQTLRDLTPELWTALWEEVQIVNGLGAAEKNSPSPSIN